jgi:hypothetical protein
MADGKITGRDIIDDSVFTRLDDLLKKLDDSIKKFREIEKNGKAAYSPDNINELTEAQRKLAIETDKVIRGERDLIEEVKNQTNEQRALARAKAQARTAGGDTNRQIQEERAARNAVNKEIRDEIRLRRQQRTAYGTLRADVARLEQEYKELAAAQRLNTVEGKALTAEFARQRTRLNAINRSAGDLRDNVGNYPTAFRGATTAIRQFVGAFGVFEGVRLGVDFIRDSVELASSARTVQTAFEALGQQGRDAFDDIQAATRGTISELQTLTSINELANFNIDLEQSGVLFEFLALRAAQTGQSVDKLRDSLVEGLSKESLLRIDNLGISTARLNEELEKTPNFVEAVANVAREELGKDGAQEVLDQLAQSPEAAQAAFENLQLTIGRSFDNIVGLDFSPITGALEIASNSFEALSFGVTELVRAGREVFNTFTEIGSTIPILDRIFEVFSNLFSAFRDDRSILAIQVSFIRLGASIQGITAGAGAFITQIRQIFSALLNLANLDFSSIGNLATSITNNVGNLTATIGDLGSETGNAFTEKYDEALKEGFLRLQEAQAQRSKEAAGNQGQADAQEYVDRYQSVINNSPIAGITETPAIEIETEASINELKALADEATKVADSIKTSSRSVAESLLEINEETFNLAQGLFGQFENLTGVSASVFEDLAFNTVDLDTAADALNGAFSNVERAQQERLARQLEANQQYLQQIRADERLSADEKIALEERVAQEERRIRQEQAQAQKTTALFSIAVDTARAIAKVLADVSFVTALPKIATITAIGAAQAALVSAQPLPQFFKGKGPLDNYEGLATWGERGQEVLVTPGGEMFVSPNKTTPLFVGKDDIIVPSFSQFNKELNSGGEVFSRLQSKMTKETRQREEFNYKQFEKSVYKALKKAGVGPVNIDLTKRKLRY